jgi:acetate kinase
LSRLLLVVNAGSSSIKFSVYGVANGTTPLTSRYRGEIEGLGARPALRGARGEW